MVENHQFDPTTHILQSFVNTYLEQLEEQNTYIIDQIFTPFKRYAVGTIRRAEAFRRLTSCTDSIQDLLEEICRKHSIDFWLAFVRRLPSLFPHWPEAWVAYSTLAIIKWSSWIDDTTLGQLRNEKTFGVAFTLTEDDLFDCCKIANLSRILAEINTLRRWLGKGANIYHEGAGILRLDIPPEVKLAVEHYDRRRPQEATLAYEGILPDVGQLPDMHSFSRNPFFILVHPSPSSSSAVLKKSGQSFSLSYCLKPYNPSIIVNVLRPYEEAIEDLFGTSLDAIMLTLYAFNRLVASTFPFPDDPAGLVFDQSLNEEDFAHKFKFMLNFCRAGFVRFPEAHLRQSLASVPIHPFSEEFDHSHDLVNSFFSAFRLSEQQRKEIDVVRLQPIPLIYTSPGNNCYFDFLWLEDFLRWLLVRSREWYPTQHGDRFALALKRFISQRVTKAVFLPQRKEYKTLSGERAQIDLLVHAGSVLYMIECKAFSKSRQLWIGNPKATTERAQRIKQAVEQAKKAARILDEVLKTGDPELPQVERIEWIVCTPAQEYLNPLEKFGLLAADTPRVCTPEELLRHLSRVTKL